MILRTTFYDNKYTNLLSTFFEQKEMVIPTFYLPDEEKKENTKDYFRNIFDKFFIKDSDLMAKDKEFSKLCNDILLYNKYYNEEDYNKLVQLFKEKFFLFIYRNKELLETSSTLTLVDKINDLYNLLEVQVVPAIFSINERDEIVYYFYSNDKYIKQ